MTELICDAITARELNSGVEGGGGGHFLRGGAHLLPGWGREKWAKGREQAIVTLRRRELTHGHLSIT